MRDERRTLARIFLGASKGKVMSRVRAQINYSDGDFETVLVEVPLNVAPEPGETLMVEIYSVPSAPKWLTETVDGA